jgi:hypothetical protein
VDQPFDHEKAILLQLRENDAPADAFLALLEHPEVHAHQWPAPWAFEAAGIDLVGAMPDLETITRERLPQVLEVLVRLHTHEALDALALRVWKMTDERVRAFFLRRSALTIFASTFRLAPKSIDLPPPKEFVAGQILIHRFELQYRLLREEDQEPNPVAPPEEGSLVLYPFDPANRSAREEVGLPEGHGAILEGFAYGAARDRHVRVLEDVAHARGWNVTDTAKIP